LLEKKTDVGEWEETDIQMEVDQFSFGTAVGRFRLPSIQSLLDTGKKTRLRLTDKERHLIVSEFEGVLAK
jgi:hypothetical protein